MSETPDFLDGEIVAVLAEQIETHFTMSLPELARAVKAAPHAHAGATNVVHAYGLLTQAQSAVEKTEDALLAALETAVGEILDDPVMGLAQQVNEAVELRDARAERLRFLLDVPAGKPEMRTRPAPRLTTTLPAAAPAQPARISGVAR
ncbi:hypothetical protein ABZX98_07690 [Streptomyces sp. NPDC002992]|uniref:hypothetical protein n=1 Tax=Streptomyces sp. NPDC002992 TaxID=3154273 RepID=UPI0033A43A8A